MATDSDIDIRDSIDGDDMKARRYQGVGLRNPGGFRSQKHTVNGELIKFVPNEPSLVFRSEQHKKAQSIVYFLGRKDLSAIKIGWTGEANPLKRLKSARNQSRNEGTRGWELLAFICSGGDDTPEKRCHEYFKSLRIQREIFRAEPELVDYVRWLRNLYATEVEETKNAAHCNVSEWLPTADRRAPPPDGLLPFNDWLGILGKRTVTADDFHTPPSVLEAARDAMGSIDLDPASSSHANRYVAAGRIFVETDRGQDQKWFGNVWLNPPFKIYAEFAAATIRERPNYKAICLLVSERSLTTNYFQCVREMADAVCIMNGRLPFSGVVDPDTGSPTSGFCVFYAGQGVQKFRRSFSHLGSTWEK